MNISGVFFLSSDILLLNGCMDKASAIETVELGSIPKGIKPNTIKIAIHSFPARHSALIRVSVKPPR